MVVIHGTRQRHRALAQQSRLTLYLLNFLFSLHLALISYFVSTFLVARGFPETYVGVLYSAGSIMTLLAMTRAPALLDRYGNYTNMLTLSLFEFLAFVGLAFSTSLPLIFVLFMVTFIAPALISFSLDIFLARATDTKSHTSGIRGTFLTIAALAWVIAPIIGGILVDFGGYSTLFIVAALVFSPVIFIAARTLKTFRDPHYVQLNIPKFMRSLKKNRDLRNVFVAQFLLKVFYAIMVIYLPLYVHGELGMSLSSLGILIAVATMAFVFLEIPLGLLQDSRWGEKKVLIIGFFVMSGITALLTFITSSSLLIWIPVLFITRIGAAMVEVGSEGYFFKHTQTADTDDVSAFRMLYPLAYIISPLAGTVFLLFMPLNTIFVATALILLIGIPISVMLHNTTQPRAKDGCGT